MLDTVLNLGLNDESALGLARATDNERFAWDSYRRFVQMFGHVSRGIPAEEFEEAIAAAKAARGVEQDTELDVEALKGLTGTFKQVYRQHTGEEFPRTRRSSSASRSARCSTPGWASARSPTGK